MSESPYLDTHPNSTIAQLLIISMTGLNQEGNVVQHIRDTLYYVYSALHILVQQVSTGTRTVRPRVASANP